MLRKRMKNRDIYLNKAQNSIMKHLLVTLIASIGAIGIMAQSSPTIMTIDSDPISKMEFENIYKKNNKDSVISQEALDEYVELFINFKLKVKEAERLRMDTVKQFQSELSGYRKQLARPYLVDSEMNETLLREAHNRMGEEIDASHILIMVSPEDSPADTLIAYNKIETIKSNINKGKITFGEAAMQKSEDPSAKSNMGRLGYFTSLQMVYPFENAAYNTPEGEVSGIVRTRFGYHILYVHEKRDARGEIRAAHIMVKVDEKASESEAMKARAKIDEIYSELETQGDFGKLAIQYSDDKSSSRNKGELPWFGTGKMVQEFEDEAFSLNADGDYSKPFRTKYGWHIVQRLEMKGLESYDDMKKSLKQRINKDVRSQMSTRSFVSKVKKEYGFQEKRKGIAAVYALTDSSLMRGSWRPGNTDHMKKWLFKIGKRKYTQNDFVHYIRRTQGKTRETVLENLVNAKYDLFKSSSIINFEDERLESKYPDFKALMKEYRDGILLFELTDEMVWTKAVKDTSGLKNYYDTHMDDFMYEDRIEGTVFRCKDMETAQTVKSMLESGSANDEVEKTVNGDSQLNLTIMSGVYEREDDEISGKVPFTKGISDIHEVDGQFVFMDIKEVLAPAHKPFEKIKGLVTAAYQNQLESEWITELRDRYTVSVDKDVLYSVK